VRYHFRSLSNGVLAQLVERLNGIEEVRGSNPLGSRIRPIASGSGRLRRAGQTPPELVTFELQIKGEVCPTKPACLPDVASLEFKRRGEVGSFRRNGEVWLLLPLGQ
jgi:hypothetical protein